MSTVNHLSRYERQEQTKRLQATRRLYIRQSKKVSISNPLAIVFFCAGSYLIFYSPLSWQSFAPWIGWILFISSSIFLAIQSIQKLIWRVRLHRTDRLIRALMTESKRAGVKVLLMLFLITLGLVLILTKIILEQNTVDQPGWEKTLIELIGHLGIGAIILGVLSILLKSRHWTEYFKERLVDIVMEKSYMDRLTEPALLELQTDVLKSYFKNDNIGGEEGFLKYYQKNIQSIIGSPYRTNLDAVLNIDYLSPKNHKSIKVHKEMSWVCKSNGGSIQTEITWKPEKDEIDEVNVEYVKLEHPTFDLKDDAHVVLYEYDSPRFDGS